MDPQIKYFQKYRLAMIPRRISVAKTNLHSEELGSVLLAYRNRYSDAEPDSYQLFNCNNKAE